MDATRFWVGSAFLLGGAWAFSRFAPEYARLEWELLESGLEPMAARLGAARGAFRGVAGDEQSALRSRRALAFCAMGILLIALDYLIVGPSLAGSAALVFLLGQLVLGSVCQEHGILPDVVTLPLAGVALLLGATGVLLAPGSVLWGILVGAGIPFAAAAFFVASTGRAGMGEGVIKHAGAVGAWVGPAGSVAALILVSALGALYVPAVRIFTGRVVKGDVNFGPAYAAASALVFLATRMPPESLPWGLSKVLH